MKIALLCSGLGHVFRGHEVFATDLFNLLKDSVDITLLKGGGEPAERQIVVPNVPRYDPLLAGVHVVASPRWEEATRDQERMRIEAETFAYAALRPLLEGDYDVIHCLEREVCDVVYAKRHVFKRTPRILYSNGGAIPRRHLPQCDFVQEHTPLNLRYSDRRKAFMIPHGVDTQRFRPGIESNFRRRHAIPDDALVVITVGALSFGHKRVDYVIREVAKVPGAWLVALGQETADTPAIRAIAQEVMGERALLATLPHSELPFAYAASDVFVLGSEFETFGIVLIEAMAMGLPVVCTRHPNQKSIVKEGVFINVRQDGALADALRGLGRTELRRMGHRAREIAVEHYDLQKLKQQYIEQYSRIADTPATLPRYDNWKRLQSNVANAVESVRRIVLGRAE
jgi:glycosyltransferase involved in cell wall biosynthesis